MIARVAIDLALDRLFDYTVPEALEKKLSVGQLLSVPFGRRSARGFVIACLDAPPVDPKGKSYTLRPITAILDETPFFSGQLLTLVEEIARATLTPRELVLKTALPAAVLKPGAHACERLFVDWVLGVKPGAVKLTERQKWLYEQIVRLNGGWLSSLCVELKTQASTLRQIAAKGLITILPRQARRDPLGARRIVPTRPLPLNDAQQAALTVITDRADKRPVLLFGVTGSGKTEVYLQAIAAELAAGRGAIVLVPEIALTPQTVQRFASRFGSRVAVLHSALSDGARYDEWHRIRSGEARVVVGPRSAVFAPVQALGLIVVDEEHETSYKQDHAPRYHAREVAVWRGRIEGAKVILGSATPSLESWLKVSRGEYASAAMAYRAGAGRLPAVHLVDMTGENGGFYSKELLEAIGLRLARHEQTILFLNRRGYSRSVRCEACGYVATCPACDVPYTYHRVDRCLRCHICGGWIEPPKKCPKCGAEHLTYQGLGTQRAEQVLSKCFPKARILRMDADSTSRRHSHDDLLDAFRRFDADILLGTQMIAKGLDFPNVTLVGVLNADSSLNMPDFRAAERTFQLLSQVAGRAGRAELPGEVFIQTFDPEVAVLALAAEGAYEKFAKDELLNRAELWYPPYSHLAVLTISGTNLPSVTAWAEMYARSLQAYARKGNEIWCEKSLKLIISDAFPSAIEKKDGVYTWQIILRASNRALVSKSIKWLHSVRPPEKNIKLALDIDAYDFV